MTFVQRRSPASAEYQIMPTILTLCVLLYGRKRATVGLEAARQTSKLRAIKAAIEATITMRSVVWVWQRGAGPDVRLQRQKCTAIIQWTLIIVNLKGPGKKFTISGGSL